MLGLRGMAHHQIPLEGHYGQQHDLGNPGGNHDVRVEVGHGEPVKGPLLSEYPVGSEQVPGQPLQQVGTVEGRKLQLPLFNCIQGRGTKKLQQVFYDTFFKSCKLFKTRSPDFSAQHFMENMEKQEMDMEKGNILIISHFNYQ